MKKSILGSLFNKFGLFRLASKINSPKITAIIFFLTCSIVKSKKRNAPTMIYIHKGIGIDDIKAMAQYSNEINYIIIQSSFLREIFKYFFGATIYSNKNLHTDYHYDKNLFPVDKKNQYRNFISDTFIFFERLIKYDGFICSNYVYGYLQELSMFAKHKEKIYVVLYKEGLVSKKFVDRFIQRYTNKKFIGDVFLTYNNFIKNAFIKSNIDGFTSNNVSTVGIPRLDFYKDLKTSEENIVLFSFYPEDKFSYLENESFFNSNFKNQIEKISIDFHAYVIEYANKNLKKKLIIKTKFPKKYSDYIYKIIKQKNLTISDNISITNIQNPISLIQNASVVLGYNSTTLIESLLLDKKIITPNFYNVIPEENNIDYFLEYKDLAKVASNYNELSSLLSSDFCLDPILAKQFLEDYISYNNFQSSQNAEKTIIRYISR